jgi:myosin heavy subunit
MAFDYDKVREKIDDDLTGHWASYADLFIMMSAVFLLCYAVAKLYGGSAMAQQQADYQRVKQENDDLKEQLKVYSTLKDDYLKTGATPSEQKMYRQLMNKLSLLRDEAKQEKEDLEQQAHENDLKEQALSKYQQMVRNIINSNLVASARIRTRDQMLDQKDEQLDQKQEEISQEQGKLQQVKNQVQQLNKQIQLGQQKITDANNQLAQRREELQAALKEHQISTAKFKESLQRVEQQTQAQVNKLKSQNNQMNQTLASATQQVQSLSQQKESLQRQTASLQSEAESLKGQTQSLRGQTAALRSQKDALQGSYEKLRQVANARRDLASRIKNNFAKAGIKAEVDAQTGDVTIGFGDEYFETDRANLKPRMTNILKETIPVYSRSLFEDLKISSKIKAVEIIGFASPTYNGKFVDPKSLSMDDRTAVNYNMDLSYRRARSIFDYIFDPGKMSYENQERLLPLVKVTGRSYLAEKLERGPASVGTSVADYCLKYDCKQAQKVIIKFNLGE